MIEYNKNNLNGWVKVFRSLSEKGWYKKSDYVHLWVHLLFKATHKGIEYFFNGENLKLKSGQFITGRKKLSDETGINESKIERILNFFEKNEQQIEQQKNNKNRIITILNWDLHQLNEQQAEQQLNSKRTTTEQQLNTYKNVKNDKNVKKQVNPSFEEIQSYGLENGYDLPVKKIIDFYTDGGQLNYWVDSKNKKVQRWRSKLSSVWFKPEYKLHEKRQSNFKPLEIDEKYK